MFFTCFYTFYTQITCLLIYDFYYNLIFMNYPNLTHNKKIRYYIQHYVVCKRPNPHVKHSYIWKKFVCKTVVGNCYIWIQNPYVIICSIYKQIFLYIITPDGYIWKYSYVINIVLHTKKFVCNYVVKLYTEDSVFNAIFFFANLEILEFFSDLDMFKRFHTWTYIHQLLDPNIYSKVW